MTLTTEALARVTTQYADAVKFKAHIAALIEPLENVMAALESIRLTTDIDASEGVQLDVLGELVGISRTVPRGALVGVTLVDVVATDAQYRVLIKARAFKNSSHASPDDIVLALFLLFPTLSIDFEDTGDMAIAVTLYGAELDPFTRAVIVDLDLLPRASGVFLNLASSPTPLVFGFEGQPRADVFGEEGEPLVGSPFLEEA